MKNKLLENPLGVHKNSHEFQVGSTLVWIYTDSLGVSESLKRANHNFKIFWEKRAEAIAAAEAKSRKKHPALWRQHEAANQNIHPLSVHGIWYDPDSGEVHYEVNVNHEYPHDAGLPEFPEEAIMIEIKIEP